ncbi:hypothetical protein AVEN_79625-1 [Araneus ventricosus]|uniref:Uncharacterized protein n=1 Tax=Araneus ventricosus TaxID=182803 RepID=A0A4Y2G478_ARAVE|nr:hypothetical protein AVEN_79625-1 [Araneus ventricosus]
MHRQGPLFVNDVSFLDVEGLPESVSLFTDVRSSLKWFYYPLLSPKRTVESCLSFPLGSREALHKIEEVLSFPVILPKMKIRPCSLTLPNSPAVRWRLTAST